MQTDLDRVRAEQDAVMLAHINWADAIKRLHEGRAGAMTAIQDATRNYQKALDRWADVCKKFVKDGPRT